jgi:hypothetical protein
MEETKAKRKNGEFAKSPESAEKKTKLHGTESDRHFWSKKPELLYPRKVADGILIGDILDIAYECCGLSYFCNESEILSDMMSREIYKVKMFNFFTPMSRFGASPKLKFKFKKSLIEKMADENLNTFQIMHLDELTGCAGSIIHDMIEYLTKTFDDDGKLIVFTDKTKNARCQYWRRIVKEFPTAKAFMDHAQVMSWMSKDQSIEHEDSLVFERISYLFANGGEYPPGQYPGEEVYNL